jgi:hypothetical protein
MKDRTHLEAGRRRKSDIKRHFKEMRSKLGALGSE